MAVDNPNNVKVVFPLPWAPTDEFDTLNVPTPVEIMIAVPSTFPFEPKVTLIEVV